MSNRWACSSSAARPWPVPPSRAPWSSAAAAAAPKTADPGRRGRSTRNPRGRRRVRTPAATGLLVVGAQLVRPDKTRWGAERGYRELTTDLYRDPGRYVDLSTSRRDDASRKRPAHRCFEALP
ncbi:exported protein of unknown function [Blastococcus saxobsidens DD2]|uniref:Uncharacterized protein n=1 Tax=Blastococcus saxobsidens (strain DD2) TaxID=1146883 RepID=H6RLG5_BLASD|nr:exported protein of unknown function [Blastococcus saxobsidens DD2]